MGMPRKLNRITPQSVRISNKKQATNSSLPTSDLCAEVYLHDVAVLQHRVVSHIGRVVRRHVVDAAARGERNARL